MQIVALCCALAQMAGALHCALLKLTSGYAAEAQAIRKTELPRFMAIQQAACGFLAEQTGAANVACGNRFFLSPVTSLRHSVSLRPRQYRPIAASHSAGMGIRYTVAIAFTQEYSLTPVDPQAWHGADEFRFSSTFWSTQWAKYVLVQREQGFPGQ